MLVLWVAWLMVLLLWLGLLPVLCVASLLGLCVGWFGVLLVWSLSRASWPAWLAALLKVELLMVASLRAGS